MWIKGQLGLTLIKANAIQIVDEKYITAFGIDNKQNLIVGEYKSKERCIEILDEICKSIHENKTIELYSNIGNVSKCQNIEYTTIYEMPKE